MLLTCPFEQLLKEEGEIMKASALLLLTSLCACFGQITDDVAIDYAESRFSTNRYSCVLMRSDLKSSPKWNSEKEVLPLQPTQASSLALEKVEQLLGRHPLWPHSPGWDATRISLVQDIGTNSWYYRIEMIPRVPGSGSSDPVTLFVTLDKKVISLDRRSSGNSRRPVGRQ